MSNTMILVYICYMLTGIMVYRIYDKVDTFDLIVIAVLIIGTVASDSKKEFTGKQMNTVEVKGE